MGGSDAAKPNGQHNGGGCQMGASQAEGAPGSKMPPLMAHPRIPISDCSKDGCNIVTTFLNSFRCIRFLDFSGGYVLLFFLSFASPPTIGVDGGIGVGDDAGGDGCEEIDRGGVGIGGHPGTV